MTKPSFYSLLLGLVLQCFFVEFLQAQTFSKHPSESEYFYHDASGNRSGLSFPYAIKLLDRLMWIVKNQNGYGIVNEGGEVIVEPGYDYIGSFQNDLAIVIDDGYLVLSMIRDLLFWTFFMMPFIR